MLVTKDEKGSVRILTINRPDKLNALNRETIAALHGELKDAVDSGQVRVIVLTGAGEKAFVAGADIAEFAHFGVEEGQRLSAEGQEQLFDYVEGLSVPVIAAVNGYALGGGLELAMACHIRIGSEKARLGLPEVGLGLIPGYGGTQRLPQLIGRGRALELICSARHIDAETAVRYGLLNRAVAHESLLDTCLELAGTIARQSPAAIRSALRAVQAGMDNRAGFRKEIEEFGRCFGTEDFREGTTAFLEKRPPDFSGR